MSASHSVPEITRQMVQDPRWELVLRVASSQHLKASARLKEFLLYVAECAIRGVPEEATEQQIGIHVFRRAAGYNSSDDSIVRTHARLLRQKLAAYFVAEGAGEPVIIEIPKGHYLPSFISRPVNIAGAAMTLTVPAVAAPKIIVPPSKPPRVNARAFGLIVLGIMTAVIVALAAWAALRPTVTQSSVDTFWQPFLSEDPPVVIYSNALFVGDSKNGLRYASPEGRREPLDPDQTVDNYTGIGEVASVYELTKLFDTHHASFILKRSLLVTWDEAKSKNLIFIGSTAENPSLKVMPATTDFSIMSAPGYAGILNHNPKAGEPALYSRPEHPMTKDYAILALLPGVQQGRRMLIFSGLTTLGTQAAVEFACRRESLNELLRSGGFPHEQVRPFEAVLEVDIAGGVPIQSRIVTVRVH